MFTYSMYARICIDSECFPRFIALPANTREQMAINPKPNFLILSNRITAIDNF